MGNMETRDGLGEMIRTARLRRGWTQRELAARLDVDKSYISQWETGARKWPQEHIKAIARELGLSQVAMAVAAGLIETPPEGLPEPPRFPPGSGRARSRPRSPPPSPRWAGGSCSGTGG
jgi:transcriptional regulator with XRE-family HTH domain